MQLGVRENGDSRARAIAICFLAVAALLTLGTGEGQSQSLSPAHQVVAGGLDSTRVARIDALLEGLANRGEVAGLVATVALDGVVRYEASVGWQDLARRVPMSSSTLFRIASMTKPITAVSVLMLQEEGALLLSDPVAKYLPELSALRVLAEPGGDPTETVSLDRPITIRDLLTHTSGFSYGFSAEPLDSLYRARGIATSLVPVAGTMADNIRRLATVPLAHQPGTAWRYGVSFDVLGRVVEVVSGRTLPEFFRSRIFEPLGMRSTTFEVQEEREPLVAVQYAPADDGTLRPMGRFEQIGGVSVGATVNIERPLRYFSGGGNLVSTPRDYLRFLEMLRNGGVLDGVRLLSPKSVELMTANHIAQLPDGSVTPGAGFGLGVEVIQDIGRWGMPGTVGAYRWGGIYGTAFWVDPAERLTAVLFFQRFPRAGLNAAERFAVAVYQALVR